MDEKNNIRFQYEKDILEYDGLGKELEILLKAISFLNEQIETNKVYMTELVTQLENMNVEFTYDNSGMLQITSSLEDVSDWDRVQLMITSYHTYLSKNKDIEENINDIRSIFLKQLNENSMKEISEEIERKGLSILQAQEKERSRIACDLHDSIIQNLANLVHKTELCIRTIDRDTVGVKLDLLLMMQNIKGIIDDIRAIIYNLRPISLEDLGLDIAIARFLNQFEINNKVSIQFKNECKEIVLKTSVVSLTLFRIIQEACSNAVKHGHASSIEVNISNDDYYIILCIRDNGIGFDIKNENAKMKTDNSGFGLSIMKERIYLLSGNINIDSSDGKGTQIIVQVPIRGC